MSTLLEVMQMHCVHPPTLEGDGSQFYIHNGIGHSASTNYKSETNEEASINVSRRVCSVQRNLKRWFSIKPHHASFFLNMEMIHQNVFSFVFWGTNSELESPLMYEVPELQQGSASSSSGSSLGSSITACKKVTLPNTTLLSPIELEHYFSLTFQALLLKQEQQQKHTTKSPTICSPGQPPDDIQKSNSWKWSENSSISETSDLKILSLQCFATPPTFSSNSFQT